MSARAGCGSRAHAGRVLLALLVAVRGGRACSGIGGWRSRSSRRRRPASRRTTPRPRWSPATSVTSRPEWTAPSGSSSPPVPRSSVTKASLHTVKVTWFGEPGDTPVVITSAEGAVDFRERNAELRGGVRVERADGAVLSTEKLLWDERTQGAAGAAAGRDHHPELHGSGRAASKRISRNSTSGCGGRCAGKSGAVHS